MSARIRLLILMLAAMSVTVAGCHRHGALDTPKTYLTTPPIPPEEQVAEKPRPVVIADKLQKKERRRQQLDDLEHSILDFLYTLTGIPIIEEQVAEKPRPVVIADKPQKKEPRTGYRKVVVGSPNPRWQCHAIGVASFNHSTDTAVRADGTSLCE